MRDDYIMKKRKKSFLEILILILDIFIFLLFLAGSISYALSVNQYNPEPDLYYKLSLIFLFTMFIFGFILIILIVKGPDIKLFSDKANPEKYDLLKDCDINKFIIEKITLCGYESSVYETESYKVFFNINQTKYGKQIIALFDINDFNDDLYEDYKNNNFYEFGQYLINKKLISNIDRIYITFIISVSKINKNFRKVVEENVQQDNKFFRLPVGISKASKKLYIASQNIFIGKVEYKKMKQNILDLLNDILKY